MSIEIIISALPQALSPTLLLFLWANILPIHNIFIYYYYEHK